LTDYKKRFIIAIVRKAASITSDNNILAVLCPAPLTPARRTDGWVYTTASFSEKDRTNGGETLTTPVTRVPSDVRTLHDTRLLEKLSFGNELALYLQLADAVEASDTKRAATIRESLLEPNCNKLSAQEMLAQTLSDAMSGVEYVIWQEKESGKLRPGILCKTRRQVAYALLANSLGRPGGLGICERCRKLFQKHRAVQPYCSANCRVAAAMKRYRLRKSKHSHLQKRRRTKR